MEFCVYAGPDFITIDGREGNRSQPQDYQGFHQRTHDLRPLQGQEIPDQAGCGAQLVITGGLRVSSDFAKALAMGATRLPLPRPR